jgi:hypothetical protein
MEDGALVADGPAVTRREHDDGVELLGSGGIDGLGPRSVGVVQDDAEIADSPHVVWRECGDAQQRRRGAIPVSGLLIIRVL